MKIIAWPFTALTLLLSAVILLVSAFVAMAFSLLAQLAAYIIIEVLVWQESPTLIKLTTFLGTQETVVEAARNKQQRNEEKYESNW